MWAGQWLPAAFVVLPVFLYFGGAVIVGENCHVHICPSLWGPVRQKLDSSSLGCKTVQQSSCGKASGWRAGWGFVAKQSCIASAGGHHGVSVEAENFVAHLLGSTWPQWLLGV